MKFALKDLFGFERMITPLLLTILYYVLCVTVVLVCIFMAIGGRPLQGIIMIPLGLIYVRVMCELLLVIFKIYENTTKIANKE